MEKLLSVVIPTFNRVKLLKKCLASVERQTLSVSKFEVIVISDGSTDDTHDFLETFSKSTDLDFRYFVQQNAGPATARNLGIMKSKTENIVFMDDDCVAAPDWLRDYQQAIPDDLFCAGIGGEIENIDTRKRKAFFNVINANRHPVPDSCGQVPYLITANALYRKQCLLDVGGFDTRFRDAGGEDPDLSQRMIERGYYLRICKGAKIFHHDRISYRSVFKTLEGYGKGNRLRSEMKNLPYSEKDRDVRIREFKQVREKYIFRKDIGMITKLYWTYLQIAYHKGYNKGNRKYSGQIPKSVFSALPQENPIQINPSVSVIIPCFNDGKYLMEAIESVEQFPDKRVYEIIVIDDGSTDSHTLTKLRQVEQKGHKVLRPGKIGKCKARNSGIRAAKGKYILTLDADNKIEWDYIRKSLYVLNNFPEIGVVYGNHYLFGEEEGYKRVMGFDIRLMLLTNYIDTCAVFRKSAWESVGGFDENMPLEHREDWNFWLDLYRKGWLFHGIDEPMFHYRVRSDAEGRKGDLPENKKRVLKYICAKYDDIYRKEMQGMYEELKQIHNSKAIVLREKLKLPFKFFSLIVPRKS